MRNISDLLEAATEMLESQFITSNGVPWYPFLDNPLVHELREAVDEIRFQESLPAKPPLGPLMQALADDNSDEARERIPSPDPQPTSSS